jgi:hypothetical protein
MKTTETTHVVVTYTSEICPEVFSTNPADGEIIAWGDAHPVAWKIVTGTRSKPFGKNASTYMGCQRGDLPGSALSRLRTFRSELECSGCNKFFSSPQTPPTLTWRARFTMDHYKDKGFRGGFFQQFDGTYNRGCAYLDYTPVTLDEVVARFVAWCGLPFPTCAVKIDGKVIRTYDVPRWEPDRDRESRRKTGAR